jgi:hypothetical protein
MWNQCGFHVDRWGSVNCWILGEFIKCYMN